MADTSSSPFVNSISDLSVDGVMSRDIIIEHPVEWGIELSRIESDPPLEADLTMTRTRGGLIVKGRVVADVRHTCPRCLTERTEPLSVEIAQLVAEPDDLDDADAPDYLLDGDLVDLEPVIRDETLLGLPLQPVCPEGCVELVAPDQSDLNTDVPGDESTDSSPFAVLQQLIEHAD
jgi:uncharacterized protein